MPQLIDVPGFGPTEFPDGMSDSQIEEAIKRNMSPAYGATQGPGMDALGDEIIDRGKATLGGIDAAASMVASAPAFVAGGLANLGQQLAGQGQEVGNKAQQNIMEHGLPGARAIRHYEPYSDYGKLAIEGIGAARSATGDLGGDSPAIRTGAETAFDIATMLLPLGPKVRSRGGKVQEKALADAEIEKRAKAAKDAQAQAEKDAIMGDLKPGDQMEIPMPQQSPLYEPIRGESRVPEMMDRMNEILEGEQRARAPDQADLFESTDRSEFPGIERSKEIQTRPETIEYGLSTEEPNLSVRGAGPMSKMEAIDWPTRIEQLEGDPYFATLKDEFDKHMADYQRNMFNKERADAYGQTPRYAQSAKELRDRYDRNAAKALEKANESLKNASDVWNEADSYYKQRLKDLNIGKISAKEDLKMGRIVKGPGRKQRGSTDINFLSMKWTVDAIKKWIDEAKLRAQHLEELKNRSESGEQAAKIDDRLEKLYYQMMKANNEILRRSDPKHPLHHIPLQPETKLGDVGPGKKQRGGPGRDDSVDKMLRNKLKLNPEGFDFGGYESLPDSVKEWARMHAEFTAMERLVENGSNEADLIRGKFSPEEIKEYREHVSELLNDPDFVKQAIASSGGYNSGRVGPIVPLGSKGKIGKQRGNVDFTDPEFLKYRDSLPEPLKEYAKGAWREIKKIEAIKVKGHYGTREQPVLRDQTAIEVADSIPGLKDWKDFMLPIKKTPQELKPVILKEADLPADKFSQLGRQLVSGGKILGLGTQNTLVRYVAQGLDRVMRESQQFIEDKILNEKYGLKPLWEKLNREEQAKLWAEFSTREGLKGMSRQEMYDIGLSDKQVNAAESLRKALDRTYELLNKGREAQGKGSIEYRYGYIPSRFRGDFVVHVKDADGTLVHILGANSLPGAKKLKQWMESQPEAANLKIEDPMHEPMHRFKDASDATAGYQMMIDALSKEDPLVDALEKAYERYLQKQAYNTMAMPKHFKGKSGVKGAEGFKEWQDGYKNAQEGLRSIMNYIDHAAKWALTQIELKDARSLLKDKEVQQAQPVASAWSQAYIDQALGRSTRLARALDTVIDHFAEHTGIGQSMLLSGVRDTKYFFTSLFLGFLNTGFSLSQIVQVIQTQPALMMAFKSMGAEGAVLSSYARGIIDATKGLSVGKDKMTVLAQQAWDYALDHGIVEPKLLDDARSFRDASINKVLDKIATVNMTYFEKVARTQAYLTWVHFLNESGMKMGRELYEAAGQMTDITMVDYRQHERPMLYKQMGIIGETANALTTFKHNYYSQMWLQRQLANKHKSPAPEIAFYTTLLALGGLLSLPGREDFDALIKGFNWLSAKMGGPRAPTTRELILKLPEVVAFGPASSLSGMDLTSKFSAANAIPDDAITAAFPFAGTLADIGGAVGGFISDPSMTTGMKLSQAVSPTSSRGLHESYFEKNGITQNPKTLEGQYRRDGGDKAARVLALRSLPESQASHQARTWRDEDSFYTDTRSKLLEKAKRQAFEDNLMAVAETGRKYVEAGGTPEAFVSGIINNVKEQHRTQLERMLHQSMRNPQQLQRRMGKK